jgi:hypothetical protein
MPFSTLGPSGRRNEPLNVIAMAAALVLAAVTGAALGLAWHALGGGEEEEPAAAGENSAE